MENALFLVMCVAELSSPCSVFIDEIVVLFLKQSLLLLLLPAGSCNPKADLSNPMLLLHIRTFSDRGVWGLDLKAQLKNSHFGYIICLSVSPGTEHLVQVYM